ncbi:TlpA family protein disulfide reductase [Aquimarina sp. 2304DJ70-9]|uniref:TlpA family protein disulfide reductase n=1 Tax=Aquimarina penaris TaxID=3231044 RepID=UPI0034620FE9
MKQLLRYIIPAIIIVISLFYLYIKYSVVDDGEEAPDFETILVDGTSFKLSDLRGKYVLLNFWGSWCPPCRKENPKLVALHHKYSDQLTIVTVALEKDLSSWKKASKKDGFVWKNQIVDQNKYVMLSSIARKYGVSAIPAKFLISPEGKLLGKRSFEEIENILSSEKVDKK